jgi:hypothetical protein
MKQRLGLNANFGTHPASIQLWRKARAYAVLSVRSGCPLLMERGSSV